MRNIDCDIGYYYCYGKFFLEYYSDVEMDRFDISNGSLLWNLENVDIEKEEFKKIEDYKYVDFGFIDVIFFYVFK